MVSNLFLRLCWLFTVSPNYWGVIRNGNIVAYGSALVEVFRRFQWNFFRMENEHTNNCGEFRAVKEMPLPYHIPPNSDDDDDNANDTIDNRTSNFQNFVKKLNKNSSNNNNEMNSCTNGNTIDITKFQYFQKEMTNNNNNNNNNNNSNNNNIDNNPIKLKRSHSQEHISINKNCKYYNDNDTINISNIKFWNIKPNHINKNIKTEFDIHDPLNSNRTIHTYNVNSEFGQYIAKMKENLSSIDTIIKQYDYRKDSNMLNVRIEDFPSEKDKFMKSHQNSFEKNESKDNDTFRVDIDDQNDNILKKEYLNILNSPLTLTNIDDASNISSSSLENSESITIYELR